MSTILDHMRAHHEAIAVIVPRALLSDLDVWLVQRGAKTELVVDDDGADFLVVVDGRKTDAQR